ncbi:MAG: glycosyltransferase [Clostridia bacterium]|nr:glycosyltransferase [Clostridia bacterium]
MKRILIIIEAINIGGTGSSLKNLLANAKEGDYDITVGILSNYEKSVQQIGDYIKTIPIDSFSRPSMSKIQKIKTLFFCKLGFGFFINYLGWLINEKNRQAMVASAQISELIWVSKLDTIDFTEEYDVVISWCEMYTNYLLANKIKANKKVGFVHPDYIGAKFTPKYDKQTFEKLDCICAVSKTGANSLKTAFPEYSKKIRYVYNKLQVNNIVEKSNATSFEYSKDLLNIVTVARMQNLSKGFDRIVRVAKRLSADGLDFVWRIVGDGEDRQSTQKQIDKNGLAEKVIIEGMKENPYPYVAQADLFALCSYYEGFPMVVDEALALGVPCFVTEYSSAREQVSEDVGFVVENNEDAIYKGLKSIITYPEQLVEKRERLSEKSNDSFADCSDFYEMIESVL